MDFSEVRVSSTSPTGANECLENLRQSDYAMEPFSSSL